MPFDVVLPSVVSAIIVAIVELFPRFEPRIKSIFEEKEFRIRDAFFLVVAMGAMVTAVVFVPQQAIQILFLGAYSFVLFLFTYIAVEKWFISVLPPLVFLVLYLSGYWNIILVNLFAVFFAVLIVVYLGGLFSWTTVLVFAALIVAMDVVQVLVTNFMGAAAERFAELELPILIQVPTYPVEGWIGLGLGDIFLAGLLAIQGMRKYGRKAAFISAVSIGFAFFIYEVIAFSLRLFRYFPATIIVVCGWLLSLGLYQFIKLRGSS